MTKRKIKFYDTKGLLFQTFLLILHFDVESAICILIQIFLRGRMAFTIFAALYLESLK